MSLENLESKQTDVSGSARFFLGGCCCFLFYAILFYFAFSGANMIGGPFLFCWVGSLGQGKGLRSLVLGLVCR